MNDQEQANGGWIAMLYFSELHESRTADLRREAERERLADAARAARRESARGRRHRRFAARLVRGGQASYDTSEALGEPVVTTAGRAPVGGPAAARAPDGSVPRPRRSVSARR